MGKLIYVVEDDRSIREMLELALLSFSYEVKAFDNAEDAVSAASAGVPDMIIFDIMLPGASGLEATKLLRKNPRTARVIIVLLTAKATEMDKVTGLDCGADDYITKPFSVMELGARLRSLFRRLDERGTNESAPKTIAAADLTVNHDTREVFKNGEPVSLTFKEFELLWTLLLEKDRIVPREELFLAVWGENFIGESRTLDMHIRTLREKLGDDADEPLYVKTIRNVGYRFIGFVGETI